MLRKIMLLTLVLAGVFLLGGCFPGPYVSRQATGGMVVDAVTGEPLSGVLVSYGGDDTLTDEQGAFFFSQRISIGFFFPGGEHPAWPLWGNFPRYFYKDGYYVPSYEGIAGPPFSADGKVAMEPSHIAEGITALDERITKAWLMHIDGGNVLVVLTLVRSEDFGTFEGLARETRALGEKVVRSGLAGAAPDLVFRIRTYGENELGNNSAVWDMQLGWPSSYLGALDWMKTDERQWLNNVAFVKPSPKVADLLMAFAENKANSRAYAPFIEKGKARKETSPEFHKYGFYLDWLVMYPRQSRGLVM
jgi:hypothetical protein